MRYDPRFFPFYPGRTPKRSFSLERIEKELRGEEVESPRGTGLAKLSGLRRVYPLTDKLRSFLKSRLDGNSLEVLERASFAVVQGKFEVLTGEEGILMGYSPVVSIADKEGRPLAVVPFSVKEFYSFVEKERKSEDSFSLTQEEREDFRKKLTEGLKESLLRVSEEHLRKRIERALSYLKEGELEKALVDGLTLKPHQAKEGLRIGALLKRGEDVLLGWEMRGGKTLTSLLGVYLSGQNALLLFKSSNLPDVLTQVKERLPFILNSCALLKVSGLRSPFPISEYDALGRVVPNFPSFIAKREREFEYDGDYQMSSYLRKKDVSFPKELEPYLKELVLYGYDEELTKKALSWLYSEFKGDEEKIKEVVSQVFPVKVYEGKERFVFCPSSRLFNFFLSSEVKNVNWLSEPCPFGVVLLDEADQFAGIESSYVRGLAELSKKSKRRVFLTGTFTSGKPENAVALSCLLKGKSYTYTKEAYLEAEKELGVFSVASNSLGLAVSFALSLYGKGKDFSPSSFDEEDYAFWRQVKESSAFDIERRIKPEDVVKRVLKRLEDGYEPLEVLSKEGVAVKREVGTFNPIAFAHSLAPSYFSLASRETLSGVKENLTFDVENAQKTLSLTGKESREEFFSPSSYPLRKAVDTALERYSSCTEVFQSREFGAIVKRIKKLESENPRFRRRTSTSKDGLTDYFYSWLFKGKEPPEEIKEVLFPFYEEVISYLPKKPYEKLRFKRPGWPFSATLTYTPYFSKASLIVDSFSNLYLYQKVVQSSKEGKSFILTGSMIAPNAFYLIDSMVNSKEDTLFVWRKTGTLFDKFIVESSKKLGREIVVCSSTSEFSEVLKRERGRGRTVVGASTDEAIARGVDLSFMDLMVITLPPNNLSTAVQLYSRLFSVERFSSEVFLFGTYLREIKGKLYPSSSFHRARKSFEAVEFSKAVLEGNLPVSEKKPSFELSPLGTTLTVENEIEEFFGLLKT